MEIEYYAGLKTAGNKISEYKVLSGLNIVSSLIVRSLTACILILSVHTLCDL